MISSLLKYCHASRIHSTGRSFEGLGDHSREIAIILGGGGAHQIFDCFIGVLIRGGALIRGFTVFSPGFRKTIACPYIASINERD